MHINYLINSLILYYKKKKKERFGKSNILNNEQAKSLKKLITFPENVTLTLIYQATRDGFDASQFHKRCDNITNTLTVIKSSKSFIFGGFTTLDWSGNVTFKYDSNAFLFSLINSYDMPVKMMNFYPEIEVYSIEGIFC